MIVEERKGDVFKSQLGERPILFAINAEGFNDAGFAGLVARKFWPHLGVPGSHAGYPGQVFTRAIPKQIRLHAAIIHSLGEDGWRDSPKALAKALDRLVETDPYITGEDVIAAVKMGDGPVGRAMGAPVDALMDVLRKSPLRFRVYSL